MITTSQNYDSASLPILYKSNQCLRESNIRDSQWRKKVGNHLQVTVYFRILLYLIPVAMSENKILRPSAGSRCAVQATISSELVMAFLVFSFAASSGVVGYLRQALQLIGYVNIVSFVITSVIFAYLLGRKAGIVIHQNARSLFYISYKTGLLVIIYSTLATSLLACIIAAITTGLPADWFMLYITKPLAWMLCLSCLPIILAGSWYGFTMAKSAGE
jgi:hypothetical protein